MTNRLYRLMFTVFLGTTAFLGSVASAAPQQFILFKTCTFPMSKGKYFVQVSADKKSAKVSFSGGGDFEVDRFLLGPVSHFDFVNPKLGLLRMIVAIDEGHELHKFDPESADFVFSALMKCN